MKAAAACLALLLPGSALAWEFTPGLPCLLTYENDAVSVELTHDPIEPRYSISITPTFSWPAAETFSLQFVGPFGLTISTDRQKISQEGRRLTVTDQGFGNVLNGMQFNSRMVALLGAARVEVPLTGAEAPVTAFRACTGVPSV